jgi:hypothetical protein
MAFCQVMRSTVLPLLALGGCSPSRVQAPPDIMHDLAPPQPFDLAQGSNGGDMTTGKPPQWVSQTVTGFNVGPFSDLWGASSSDIWAVGTGGNDAGYVQHSPGGGVWAEVYRTGPLYAVWGSGPSDIYLGGLDLLLHSSDGGANWKNETLPKVPGSWLIDRIWGNGANDIYAGGFSTDASGTKTGSSILHSTGNGTWTAQFTDNLDSYSFSIWGADASHMFAVNRQTGAVLRSSGNGTWAAYGALGPSGSIWGLGAGKLFVSGGSGTLYQSADAMSWTPNPIAAAGSEQLADVWGTSGDDLFVVGVAGSIFHLSGGVWSKEGVGGAGLRDIWGSGSDVYVAGDDGIYHRQ